MTLLIIADDLNGALNMALDEILWNEASSGSSSLRIYGWSDRPVLSLGYFQRASLVRQEPAFRNIPYVRRLTGGGAVVHDDEITYSLTLPGSMAPSTNELYRCVHCAVASSLRSWGMAATVGGGEDTSRRAEDLCFSRHDSHAVCVGGVKVLGSAQRRRAGAVLMHGSLILKRSPAAPHVPGLYDLSSARPSRRELESSLVTSIQSALALRLAPTPLSEELLQRASMLAEAKYAAAAWNDRGEFESQANGRCQPASF